MAPDGPEQLLPRSLRFWERSWRRTCPPTQHSTGGQGMASFWPFAPYCFSWGAPRQSNAPIGTRFNTLNTAPSALSVERSRQSARWRWAGRSCAAFSCVRRCRGRWNQIVASPERRLSLECVLRQATAARPYLSPPAGRGSRKTRTHLYLSADSPSPHNPNTQTTVALPCIRNSGVRATRPRLLRGSGAPRPSQHRPDAIAMYCLPFIA